jgi:putative transposase
MQPVCRNVVPAGLGLSLSTCCYDAQRPAADTYLSGRITDLAIERRRFGYRRIWQLLRREGLHVNHKRVYRIYHLNGLSVKRRRRRYEFVRSDQSLNIPNHQPD